MKKHTILYVEDEQWLMAGVIDSLSIEYNVLKARNGDQALAYLESDKHHINLIVLDIMMPSGKRVHTPRGRTSGVEFARIVKEDNYNIPIVCYTVVSDRKVHDELYKLGVKEIVPKTKLPSELEKVIKEVLTKQPS